MLSSKALVALINEHVWDHDTKYCTRCGVSMKYVEDYQTACVPADSKVTGISHIIAKKRIAKLAKAVEKAKK